MSDWNADPATGCGLMLLILFISFLIMAGIAFLFLWGQINANF